MGFCNISSLVSHLVGNSGQLKTKCCCCCIAVFKNTYTKHHSKLFTKIKPKKKKKRRLGTKEVSASYFQTFQLIPWELWSPASFTSQLWCLFAPEMTAGSRLLAKQPGGCGERGGGKKWLKEELGRGICPQGNFSQLAVSQHSHCVTAAVQPQTNDSGSSALTTPSQHGQAAMSLWHWKPQRWRYQDSKTYVRPHTQGSCGDLPPSGRW